MVTKNSMPVKPTNVSLKLKTNGETSTVQITDSFIVLVHSMSQYVMEVTIVLTLLL
jgi:hypothetical protein